MLSGKRQTSRTMVIAAGVVAGACDYSVLGDTVFIEMGDSAVDHAAQQLQLLDNRGWVVLGDVVDFGGEAALCREGGHGRRGDLNALCGASAGFSVHALAASIFLGGCWVVGLRIVMLVYVLVTTTEHRPCAMAIGLPLCAGDSACMTRAL